MPTTSSCPLFYLDLPTAAPTADTVEIAGWLASSEPIEDLHIVTGGSPARAPLEITDRPDVRRVHPEQSEVIGFNARVPSAWLPGGVLEIAYTTNGRTHRFRRAWAASVDPRTKSEKLDRILPLLRPDLPCPRTDLHFNFLEPELRERYKIVDVDAVSSHAYDPVALGIISRFHDGLILDAGAGCNRDYRPNVVNLEIVPYPSTDVLAVGEELPFRDDTFDAVFSLSVLEHVKDPFRCARELQRVLKPGGILYAAVPFLQPYHGYPHHYYNMTHQGLANLFEDMRVDRQQVPQSGHPIWTLSWFLGSYSRGLPQSDREQFEAMTVAQLLANPVPLLGAGYVANLSAETALEIASATTLLATKEPSPPSST